MSQQARDDVKESLTIMDKSLENSKWFAGDHLTIADFSAVTTVTNITEFGYDLAQHPNIHRWYKQCHSLTGFDENLQGAKKFSEHLKGIVGGSLF